MSHGNTFPKSSRLLKTKDFQKVFKQYDDKMVYRSLVVFTKKNYRGIAKLGIVISKRSVNKAVDRNFIKRLVRESFRQNRELLKSIDIIVLIKSKVLENLDNFRSQLIELWKILKESHKNS